MNYSECSLLLGEEASTTQSPLHLGIEILVGVRCCLSRLGLEIDVENLIMLQSLGIFVDWAVIVRFIHICKILSSLVLLTSSSICWCGGRDCRNKHDREWGEENLWLRIIKSLVSLIPTGTFKEETMDQD